MNNSSTSPANSSVSTTAVVSGSGSNGGLEDNNIHFPNDFLFFQDRKDDALLVLKTDLIAALNKEVKSLDEDSWMFEGPRSRIHIISRPGEILNKKMEIPKNGGLALPK